MRSADHSRDGTAPPAPTAPERRTAYEVLAVASRALLLEQVRAHPAGVDTATLARLTGLHPNTVRFHLDVLMEAGLVTGSADRRLRPGRPRLRFAAAAVAVPPRAPDATTDAQADGYALLASALVRYLAVGSAGAADPGAEAEAAGRSWVADSAEQGTGPARSDEQAVTELTALFATLGFAPDTVRDRTGWRILLHRCPFHSLAAEHPEVVCRLHLGLLQGALDRLGRTGEAVRLQPFLAPGLCEAFVPLAALQPRA